MGVASLKSLWQLKDFLPKKRKTFLIAMCQVLLLWDLKKPDWLKVEHPDVGVECKQSHVVKCSIDHEKCFVDHRKNKPMWVSMQHTYVFGHMTKILNIKAYCMGILTHNWVKHHAGNRETTRDWYLQGIVSMNGLVATGLIRMKQTTNHKVNHRLNLMINLTWNEMVLICAWPLLTNTMGIKTTDFVLLPTNSGNGMQMFSLEGGKIWLTTTLEKRSKLNSYSTACLLRVGTRGLEKLMISWQQVYSNSSRRYQVKVTCTPPLYFVVGWGGFRV